MTAMNVMIIGSGWIISSILYLGKFLIVQKILFFPKKQKYLIGECKLI